MFNIRHSYLYSLLRSIRNAVYPLAGYLYDYYRYLRHANWFGSVEGEAGDYRAAKTYHRIEKSLSYRIIKASSGWTAVRDLYSHYLLKAGRKGGNELGFQEQVGKNVLANFVSGRENENAIAAEVSRFLKDFPPKVNVGGVDYITRTQLEAGILDEPEKFFKSRRSVRDFSPDPVRREQVERAIELAATSPSVCNRQAWHVYCLDSRSSIDMALRYQNGNSGFGHEIPCLLVVTADLRAFVGSGERNQHWIDGGMFSMSLVLAFHSIGLSTCCLNWSKGPADDLKFRIATGISKHHSIVMLIAVGYPRENIKVCASSRRPVELLYTQMN